MKNAKKKKPVKKQDVKEEKPSESKLMGDVEKFNPEFVKWLRNRKVRKV